MYNLVVGVIAGVIMGVLAVAGAWYGGAVYERARLRAELVAVVGQQQQVAAALDLYQTEGGRVSSLGDDGAALTELVEGGFLKDIPPGTWRVRRGGQQMWNPLRIQTPSACAAMNGLAGFPEVCPPCDSETLSRYPACELPEKAA
jgi:type II secretory pathway pseudopilin PulG